MCPTHFNWLITILPTTQALVATSLIIFSFSPLFTRAILHSQLFSHNCYFAVRTELDLSDMENWCQDKTMVIRGAPCKSLRLQPKLFENANIFSCHTARFGGGWWWLKRILNNTRSLRLCKLMRRPFTVCTSHENTTHVYTPTQWFTSHWNITPLVHITSKHRPTRYTNHMDSSVTLLIHQCSA